MRLSIEDRVARGAALLDQMQPGWENDVDLSRLDIGLCNTCIVGQLFGNYNDVVVDAFDRRYRGISVQHNLGLYSQLPEERTERDYLQLTGAWRAAIIVRLQLAEQDENTSTEMMFEPA